MSLKYRRILYIFFILIFFLITPLIWLYASGYTLKNGFNLEKTGILIIDSEPSGAKIFLNNKLQKNFLSKILNDKKNYIATPAKIKNLQAKEYEVRLEFNGYWPWQKKLIIKPGKSTFAEDIKLFKKTIPLKLLNNTDIDFSICPNEKYLITSSKNTAIILDLNNKKQNFFLSDKNIDFKKIQWSSNNLKFISKNYIFDIKNWQNPIDLKKTINGNNIQWKDEDNIYYLQKHGLLAGQHRNLWPRRIFSGLLVKNISCL